MSDRSTVGVIKLIEELKSELENLASRITVDDECMKHMYEMYSLIWCNACYDPDSESVRVFSEKLLPHIRALNERFKFKR